MIFCRIGKMAYTTLVKYISGLRCQGQDTGGLRTERRMKTDSVTKSNGKRTQRREWGEEEFVKVIEHNTYPATRHCTGSCAGWRTAPASYTCTRCARARCARAHRRARQQRGARSSSARQPANWSASAGSSGCSACSGSHVAWQRRRCVDPMPAGPRGLLGSLLEILTGVAGG